MTTLIQRSMAGGEIAPALYARTDTTKYATGLRTARNFFIRRHGGADNRSGTGFTCETENSSETSRLIPWIFNDEQAYPLLFGDQTMRVIRNGVLLTDLDLAITNITNASPAVVTYTGTDPSNGDEVAISGILGAIAPFLNGRNFRIANVNGAANTFELKYLDGTNVDSSAFGAYSSAGTASRVYQIATPYLEAHLKDLRFAQFGDVMTIVHPSYAPRELSRSAHTSWTLASILFVPSIAAPTGVTATGAPAGVYWAVTAVAPDGEESQASLVESRAAGTVTIDWNAVTGAATYNVYRLGTSGYELAFEMGGQAGVSAYQVIFASPSPTTDPTVRLTTIENPFGSADNYPSAVAYYQQRLVLGNTNNLPETTFASRSGSFKNFSYKVPLTSADRLSFALTGGRINPIKHYLDLGRLIIFTAGGEHVVEGDDGGAFTPTSINQRQRSYNGCGRLRPLVANSDAIYVQARGSKVRDLAFDYQVDGYKGNDLTIFASHLFDGYTLVDWDYQQEPHSIAWAARSDGKLLSLTYIKEQQIFAWTRHDTDGTVENVCVVPEGTEDVVYVIVKRTINGATKRYVERLSTRLVSDIRDAVFMDSSLSFDGRNSDTSWEMTLSGGTTWENDELLTLTSDSGIFTSDDVGNEVHLTGSDGSIVRFTIDSYTSSTVVQGRADRTVAASLQGVGTATWARAVDQITGLWHLEAKQISVLGDGAVVASPNNAAYTAVTVTNGTATLDRCYAVIHAGLPYLSDIETLDIDTVESETLSDKRKYVGQVSVKVEATRTFWAGNRPPSSDSTDPIEGLYEPKLRNLEGYDSAQDLVTGDVPVQLKGRFSPSGRIFIRNTDPLPLSVLSIAPAGLFPFRRTS